MSNVLVTGMSGTGKFSAVAELGGRGYRVVEADDAGWSERVENSNEVGGGEWLRIENRMAQPLFRPTSARRPRGKN